MNSPRLILVAGANGAGKSTLTKRLAERFSDRFGLLLDPDAIAKRIDPENPRAAGIQAARVVLSAIDRCFEHGERLVVENTLSEQNRHSDLLQKARLLEYKTWLFYIGFLLAGMTFQTRIFYGVSSAAEPICPLRSVYQVAR